MAWVDNQRGQWVWQGDSFDVNGESVMTPKPTTPPPSAGAQPSGGSGGGRLGVSTSIDRTDPNQVAQETARQDSAAASGYYTAPRRVLPISPAEQLKVDLYRGTQEQVDQANQGRDDALALADEFLGRMNPPAAPANDPAAVASARGFASAAGGARSFAAPTATPYSSIGPIAPRAPGSFQIAPPGSAPSTPTASTPTPPGGVDQSALDPYRAERAAALADQRRVLDSILSLDAPVPMTEAERSALRSEYSDLALSSANSQAMSARGGAGAVQEAQLAANQNMPALQGEAGRQARAETSQLERDRLDRYLGDVQRLNVAGGVANTIGQTATNAFGQEAQVATTDAELGTRVWEGLMKDSGLDKQLAQMDRQLALDNQKFIGSMVMDLQKLGFDYAKLSADQEMALFDNLVQIYGIDTQAATALKVAAKNKSRDVLDYVATIGGVVSAVGATAVKAGAGGG